MKRKEALMRTMIANYAPVEGGRLYYEVLGEGLPLILIHAGFLDSRMWDEQFKLFAEEFKVIRYDVRGFGKSDRPSSKFTNSNDLYSLLKHLQIPKATLIGVSNGGAIALDFAVEHPEMLEKLILVGTGVRGYENTPVEEKIWDKFDEMMKPQELAVKENRLAEAVEIDVNVWAPAQNPRNRKRILEIAMDNVHTQAEPPGKWQAKQQTPTFKRLNEIKAPTLLIVGDRDVEGMLLLSKRLQRLIPNSKLEMVEGADHVVNLSKPRQFNRLVLEFVTA